MFLGLVPPPFKTHKYSLRIVSREELTRLGQDPHGLDRIYGYAIMALAVGYG